MPIDITGKFQPSDGVHGFDLLDDTDLAFVDPRTANTVLAGPATGAAAAATFRALGSADIPDISGSYQPRDTQLDQLAGLTAVRGDLITGQGASPVWARLAISIPAANVRNVLGIDNGETEPAWKTALDATAPTTIAESAAAAAGTSLVFSHRDHTHGAPATWKATAHKLLDAIHDDTVAATPVRGDLIVANATPYWTKLALGTSGKFLKAGATDPAWASLAVADISDLATNYVTLATVQTITAEKTIRNSTADTAPLTVNALASHSGFLQSWQVNGTPVLYVNKDGTIYTASDTIDWVGQNTSLVVGAAAGPRDVTLPAMNGDAVIPLVGFGTDPAGSGEVAVVNRVTGGPIGPITATIGPIKLTNATPAGFYLISATLETETTSAGSCTVSVRLSWAGVVGYNNQPLLSPINVQGQAVSTASFPVYLASGDITWSSLVTGTIGTGKAALRIRCHYLGP